MIIQYLNIIYIYIYIYIYILSPVVEAGGPEREAGEEVELVAVGPRGEDGGGEGDVALEHAREALALVLRGGLKN